MYLITGKSKRPICRECAKLHSAKDCPNGKVARRQKIADLKSAAADWFAERDRRLGLTDEPLPGRRRKAQ